MAVKTLATKRLILKSPTLDDAESLQKYINDWDIVRNFSKGFPWPYPADGAVSFLRDVVLPNQKKTRWSWGIFLKDNPDELIGFIELINQPNMRWNRGFWIGKPFWGQGLMPEAAHVVTTYAFEHAGFEKLVLANAQANKASRRIKEKTGGKFIGIVEHEHVDPTLKKTEMWELSKDDWLKKIEMESKYVLPET